MSEREGSDFPVEKIVLPDGSEAGGSAVVTERALERNREDQSYIPVVIKRIDDSVRHPDDTLERAIEEGLEQLKRPALSLFLSAAAGGIAVGFSAMAVAVVTQAMLPLESRILTRIATAFVYPLGFVICIMSGAQLYTEHTATALYPVLDRRARLSQLLRLWFLVVAGNLCGAAVIAGLLTAGEDVLEAREGFLAVGRHLVEFPAGPLLVSSILAGMLMAQGAWLVLGTPPDSGQLMAIYIVTYLIGLGGLHHSIAGSAEMFAAWILSDEITAWQSARFILLALAGNLVGGGIFVAVLNYAHIRQTQPLDS